METLVRRKIRFIAIKEAIEFDGKQDLRTKGEAEQKRNAGGQWDRVEGRIESLIQGRVRSRGWDFSR